MITGGLKTTTALTDCLKGKKSFQWTADTQKAFEHLKEPFVSELIIYHSDLSHTFAVEPDASDVATRVILLQAEEMGGGACPYMY